MVLSRKTRATLARLNWASALLLAPTAVTVGLIQAWRLSEWMFALGVLTVLAFGSVMVLVGADWPKGKR